MAKILSKILMILICSVILLNASANSVYAAVKINMNRALIEAIGTADNHLKYYREKSGKYTYHTTILMGYKAEDGKIYPVYCVNRELPGADEGSYYITTENILKNDKIWRIIKNGYPFKTANEWGLSDEKNVYVITRFAIYCVLGQERLDYFKAEEDDKEAIAMLKALKQLVDIGENGTERQNDDPLVAEKVGKFIEKADYYVQEYKVNSTAEFSNYTISKVSGMTNGGFIADSKGNEKTTFSKDENFYIMFPKKQIKEDIDVTATISAECRAYLVLDGQTTVQGTQNYAVTMGEYTTAETTANLKENVNTGKIYITKMDSERKIGIQGAEFELLDEQGNIVNTGVSDWTAFLEFKNLYPGKYAIVETKTHEDYVLPEKAEEVKVEYNKTQDITIRNEHKKGNLKIRKVDKDNNEEVLSGVKFDLYKIDEDIYIGEYTTDKNGEINRENIRTGKYKIVEKNTKDGYNNLTREIEFEVKWNETTEIIVENEAKKGQVKVTKLDKENNEIKLEGTKFEVLDKDGNVLETITTDASGEAVTSRYAVKDYESLYLKEISTNQNYILNDDIIEVKLEENKVKEITVENEFKKGKLKISKIDKDNKNVVLGNIKFDLYSEKEGKVIGTYTTDENGEIYIENLKIGEYKIIETNTNKWYNLADEAYVKVEWNETAEAVIENELKKGQVKVIKVDSENNEIKLKDVKFDVLDENGKLLEEIKTNENGEAITSAYAIRDYKNIYLKETYTNENYVLNDEKIKVTLEANEIKEVTVENEYKKGNLKIYKVNKDNRDEKISGVVFDLYSRNEKMGTYTTDKNGEIYIQNLKIGKYKLKEKETNKWYNLSEDEIEVEVKWKETSEITIENELKKGQVKAIKVDSENEEIKLKDVQFNVLDKAGNVLETLVTNEDGEAITSAYAIRDYEKIYLQETFTNENYVLNDQKVVVELKENATEEVVIKNEKIKGQIKIVKTSSGDSIVTGDKKGTPLEGVVFKIYDSNDKFIEKISTDENGIAITSRLIKGEYKIKETKANEWYYTNPKIFTAIIKNNNEIVNVDITNEPKNPEIFTEKIGADRAEVGSKIEYDISMKNSGNTSLDNFTWIDNIPYKYIDVTKFQTGTYNQKLKYNLSYKTNLSNDEYILLMEDLSTFENYEIDFTQELADNEYVTEIKLEFGTVDVGFCSNENPHLFANLKPNLKSETTFVNNAKVTGEYNGYKVEDDSSWKTLVYKLLPKTGF